jgi:tRNA threonylcarbamoyladenosine biosynthesis protein TsaE
MQITTPDEMFALGKRIGGLAKAGDLILLNGPRGAGKTLLVQGIGAALGFTDVTSPTFVISRTHKGPLPLIHVDVYRLLEGDRAAAFLDDLDLDSAAESAVTVIEWGGQESARLSDERLEITINRSGETREVSINPVGARWSEFSL